MSKRPFSTARLDDNEGGGGGDDHDATQSANKRARFSTENVEAKPARVRKEKTKLTAELLLQRDGFTKLAEQSERLFSQLPKKAVVTDAEAAQQLTLLMKLCEEWAKQLVPSSTFDDFIKKMGKIDSNQNLQNFREAMFGAAANPAPTLDEILGTSSGSSAQKSSVIDLDKGAEKVLTKEKVKEASKPTAGATSGEDDEAAKKARIEENRKKALLKKQQREAERASQQPKPSQQEGEKDKESHVSPKAKEPEKEKENDHIKAKIDDNDDDVPMDDLMAELAAAKDAMAKETAEREALS